MAVMPSLATMAALTLFRNTANGDDDYWEPYAAPATTIQKIIRSYLARARTLLGPLKEGWKVWGSSYPRQYRIRKKSHNLRELAQRSRRMNWARIQYYGPYSITE